MRLHAEREAGGVGGNSPEGWERGARPGFYVTTRRELCLGRRPVLRRDRTHRQLYVLVIGLLAFAPAPLRSQPTADADAGFEERFLMDERSAPTFMRPEVIELLASL